MAEKKIYKVLFRNESEVFEVYAREVAQSPMFGFIEVSGLLFGERSSIVVDPTEEKLRLEFQGVDSTHVPLHAVIRIDRVERRGTPRIVAGSKGEKVATLPTALYSPPPKSKS